MCTFGHWLYWIVLRVPTGLGIVVLVPEPVPGPVLLSYKTIRYNTVHLVTPDPEPAPEPEPLYPDQWHPENNPI